MSGRRGFFAVVGGAAVSGLVTLRPSAAWPTLIMPPALVLDPPAVPAGAYPLLALHPTEMHAALHVRGLVPSDYFKDWLEGGLRVARWFDGRSEAEMDRELAEERRLYISSWSAGA